MICFQLNDFLAAQQEHCSVVRRHIMKSSYNSIYKSSLDALLYLFLYIVIPVSQIIPSVLSSDSNRFGCVILLLFSILYDCYTRYHGDMSRSERCVIFIIGIITVVLLIISLVLHQIVLSEKELFDWVYFLYTPIVLPIIICVKELTEHVRKEMNI